MANKSCISVLLFLYVFCVMNSSTIGAPPPSHENNVCGRLRQVKGQVRGREGKIVGGFVAEEGEFPWMVSFKSKYGHFCGGTVIGGVWLMSAAHCFHKNKYLDYNKDGSIDLRTVNVTLGEYSLKNGNESTELVMNLKRVHLHPKYDPLSKQNDIALIKIAESIAVAPNVVPVCLPSDNSDDSMWKKDAKATVLGWGKLHHNQDYYDWVHEMDVLRRVDVRIWDRKACIKKYNGFPRFPSDSFLCAGEQGKESCTGDSGGPMMRLDVNSNKWVIIGIVANGNKCGEYGRPGIYTLVFDFLEWIGSYTK